MGLIYDPGNMVCEGYENYRLGIEMLGDYIFHVHIKSAVCLPICENDFDFSLKTEWSQTKKGAVNFAAFIRLLKSYGYSGYLSVSDFSNVRNTVEKLKSYLEFLKNV